MAFFDPISLISRGGWNKRGGGAKVAKSINVEVGINVEGPGVECGKNLKKSINVEGGNVHGRWIFFFKISKRDFTFIREMRVYVP